MAGCFIAWLLLKRASEYFAYYRERVYAADGTDMGTNRLEVAVEGGKRVLREETMPIKFTYNVNLDMYLHVEVTDSKDLVHVISLLSSSSSLS